MASVLFDNDTSTIETVYVYKFNDTETKWDLLGNNTIPNENYSSSAKEISLDISGDGKKLIVGFANSSIVGVSGSMIGIVSVYNYNENELLWKQLEENIYGENNDNRGFSVSISTDGSRIDIGDKNGKVRAYEFYNEKWLLFGYGISESEVDVDNANYKVALNSNGTSLAITDSSGKLRAYNYAREPIPVVSSRRTFVEINLLTGWNWISYPSPNEQDISILNEYGEFGDVVYG